MLRLSRPGRRPRAINGLMGRKAQVASHSVSLRRFVSSRTVEFPPYRLLVPPTPFLEEDLEALGLTEDFTRRRRSSEGHLPCARRLIDGSSQGCPCARRSDDRGEADRCAQQDGLGELIQRPRRVPAGSNPGATFRWWGVVPRRKIG
jgi:hypothetical protein